MPCTCACARGQIEVKADWVHLNGSAGTDDFTMSLPQMEKLKDDDEPRAETLGLPPPLPASRSNELLWSPSRRQRVVETSCVEEIFFFVLDSLWEAKI